MARFCYHTLSTKLTQCFTYFGGHYERQKIDQIFFFYLFLQTQVFFKEKNIVLLLPGSFNPFNTPNPVHSLCRRPTATVVAKGLKQINIFFQNCQKFA